MIHFIIGRCGSGKSTFVSDAVVQAITQSGRNVVLLVPEQETVAWETKMASLLPPSANFRLEITNFTRLSNSVFRETGGLAQNIVDGGTRALLVWRAMLSVWDQLRVYNHCTSGREDRNIPFLLSAVDELKNSGISPADAEKALAALMAEASEQSPERADGGERADLTARLSDAVLTYAAYEQLLHEEYIDRGDLLDQLAKTLAQYPYFKNKTVFIDSFFSLTKAEEKILFSIMRQADDVTLTFACPPEEERRPEHAQISMIPDGDDSADGQKSAGELQFAEVREYLKTARVLAARAGQETEKICLRENMRHRNAPELAAVERCLFDYLAPMPERADEDRTESEDVHIIRCADVHDEAQACAAVIERLVRAGYRYADIAVAARNMQDREGIVDRVLRQHGIRCFLSETSDVAALPAVRFVLSALAVGANGWQRRDLVRLMKTGLTLVGRELPAENDSELDESAEVPAAEALPADNESSSALTAQLEGDVFELYTETWNIRGKAMYTGDPWSMNPAGYRTERTEVGEQMLRLANSAREKLVLPLERFLAVFDGGAADVRDIAQRIVVYAEECRLAEALVQVSASYEKLGMPAEAEKAGRSWDAVCDILDCMVKNLGDTKLDAGRFAGLFSRVAGSMDVGSIPTGADEVLLGSALGLRTERAKCILMLGCTEGEFPGSAAQSGAFFGERDKLALEAVGLTIGSQSDTIRAAREYFMFYRTAASAEEQLFLFTPSSDEGSLSEGALRVRDILGAMGKTCMHRFSDLPLGDIVSEKNTAEYLLARRTDEREKALLAAFTSADRPESADAEERPVAVQNETVAGAQQLLTGGERITENGTPLPARMRLSQSKIDAFVRCPMQYWSRYEMKLQPTAKAEITPPDIGNFMHAILERFFTDMAAREDVTLPLPRAETEEIARRIIADYLGKLAKSGLGIRDGQLGVQGLDGRLSYLFLRLERHVLVFIEAIMEELAQSAFKPAAFEMPIGMPDREGRGVKPIVIRTENGTEVTLQGVADRIDVYDAPDGTSYVRVVDYKTGSKTFSLDDVRRGLHVQMLIYLFSVSRNGLGKGGKSYLPAGAAYFQAKPATVSEETVPESDTARHIVMDQIERTGVFLADEDILRAMDEKLDGKYLKIKADKNGVLRGSGKSTSLVTLEEFGALSHELENVIGKIASQILAGRADADPMIIGGQNPCTWCESRMLCRRTASDQSTVNIAGTNSEAGGYHG